MPHSPAEGTNAVVHPFLELLVVGVVLQALLVGQHGLVVLLHQVLERTYTQ